ncbi:ATP-grasp fold amidoligase family protein [Nesterenkonia sp. NBAIMH1]|uniref:ATP-grasp fold amidoligase family protein n=1 Tax=Nesterenkonia sp. NBAIMH1 TaxID=2600320 RepID=UPI00143D0EBF|nr:ATP-grasp fold amidoligase family protein [Nesterenkonia sp. NBAIMH1]
MQFDKTPENSPYLRFLAREFGRRGTDLRRELSNKTQVHGRLEKLKLNGAGLGLPQQHHFLKNAEDITPEVLGDKAALKFAHGWSARGVMLLERTGPESYFDHLSLREMTVEEIREAQKNAAASFRRKKTTWIVEELLAGPQPGTLPFDYKFYMFQGQIGMVSQIDRNSGPIRNAFFDGNFRPLTNERDFRLSPSKVQPAAPLVPRSAAMLSRWAIELSKLTDAPFVRVDLYDTFAGPHFGEFTFSSGAEFKGTIRFSNALIETFDDLFLDAERRLSGEHVARPDNWSTLIESADEAALTQQPMVGAQEYERLAHYLYNFGELGGFRLAEAQTQLAEEGADPAINERLARAHSAAAHWVRANRGPAKAPEPATFGGALRQARKDHPPLDRLVRTARRPVRLLRRAAAKASSR